MKKKVIISSILIMMTIICIICLAINASAENTGGTVEQRKDEETFVKTVASIVRANNIDYAIDAETLTDELDRYVGSGKTTVTEQSTDTLLVTFLATGNIYYVNINNGSIFNNTWVSPSEIFDADGTNTDGLHIGDFVNYDAGTWTAEEIAAIQTGAIDNLVTANGSTDLPSTGFQFGGFTAGSSRNGNATPNNSIHNYVKDASTGSAITGWRVFDIEDDGTVTLISAGNPEDYYQPIGEYYGIVSEYILTGNGSSSNADSYKKRSWNDYVNTAQKATSATILTKSALDSWYSKYIGVANADIADASIFRQIYEEQYLNYQSVIDNYSSYWIGRAGYPDRLCFIEPYYGFLGNVNTAMGVRILVSLSSDIQFTETKTGTKTLTGGNMDTYGGNQTYNCWRIQ